MTPATRTERADAARNRQAVLAAADKLFGDPECADDVSMEQIATAAGVGKGTLFRRFGDRSNLLLELYALRLEPLQSAILGEAGPLGSEAPAQIRIPAILTATATFKLDNASLMKALETSPVADLFASPWYKELHTLVADLLTAAEVPDPLYTTHILLGALRADFLRHLAVTTQQPILETERQITELFTRLTGLG